MQNWLKKYRRNFSLIWSFHYSTENCVWIQTCWLDSVSVSLFGLWIPSFHSTASRLSLDARIRGNLGWWIRRDFPPRYQYLEPQLTWRKNPRLRLWQCRSLEWPPFLNRAPSGGYQIWVKVSVKPVLIQIIICFIYWEFRYHPKAIFIKKKIETKAECRCLSILAPGEYTLFI